MLHILLLILKIIGIILTVILGILVLLVCIVLFVPVRYEADGICKGSVDSLKAKVKVTWLFHLVRADIYYKERKLKWRVRIAWKKLTGGEHFGYFGEEKDGKEEKKDEEKDKEPEKVEKTYGTQESKEQKTAAEDKEAEKFQAVESVKEAAETGEAEKFPEDEKADGQKETQRSEEFKEPREAENGEEAPGECEENQRLREKVRSLWRKLRDFLQTIKGICRKIKCTIQNVCGKIKELLDKKEKLTDFITDETHVGAFMKVKDEAFRLLKNLKPKELKVKARFGFENPQRTGQVLAFLSVLYPFTEDNLEIIPDFENKVLKGKIHIKGHIRVCHFAACACRLLICKNVRSTYKDIKNFEL